MADPVKVIVFKWTREGYRSQFTAERVNTFARMLARHTTVPYELICLTDDPTGLDSSVHAQELWPCPVPDYGGGNNPNCFRRLPMFGEQMTRRFGPKWAWSDLDAFICANVDHIITDPAEFKIWRPDGGRSACNGSLVSHRAGTRVHFWTGFDPATIGTVDEFRAKTQHLGSDQAWIATQLTENDQFFEQKDGVYAFRSLRNQFRERTLAKMRRVPLRDTLAAKIKTRDLARRVRIQSRIDARLEERMETKLPPNAAIVYFPGQWHPWDADVRKVYPWIEEHYR